MIEASAAQGRPIGRDPASGRASGILIAVLGLLATARTADAVEHGGSGYVPFVLALFMLPMLYALPATRPWWRRHRYWLVASQTVLTYLPFLVFGKGLVGGVSGLLAGLVLLVVAAPASWLVLAALVVIEAALWVGLGGLPYAPAGSGLTWVLIAFSTNAFTLFGLARLVDLVVELNAARTGLAEAAVAEERLRAAASLQAAIGERLAAVAARAQAARREMTRSPAGAREQLAQAGVVARRAIADVRAVTAKYREPAWTQPAVLPRSRSSVAPRLARIVLAVVLSGFAIQNLNNLIIYGADSRIAAAAVAVTAAIVLLQLRHSRPWGGGRPPAWPWTLALQALLNYVLLPVLGFRALIFTAFLAGSALLVLRGRLAWVAFAAAVLSIPVLLSVTPFPEASPAQQVRALIYLTTVTAGVGLMVYGLSRLAHLAVQVDVLRRELARTAVLRERLRVARDVHDLLGLGLSAIALKTDLVSRLIGRDDGRARDELEELGRVCAAARAELRLVADEGHHPSLDQEITAARAVLAWAGIDVQTRVRTGSSCEAHAVGPIPVWLDAVLGTVLREAVTNILRHSNARHCTIETAVDAGVVRLFVSNDGATGPSTDINHTGQGLANLATRVESAGGRLSRHTIDDRFDLIAEIPVSARVE